MQDFFRMQIMQAYHNLNRKLPDYLLFDWLSHLAFNITTQVSSIAMLHDDIKLRFLHK